jgi:FAD/FMN-containing dehydrogenase
VVKKGRGTQPVAAEEVVVQTDSLMTITFNARWKVDLATTQIRCEPGVGSHHFVFGISAHGTWLDPDQPTSLASMLLWASASSA